MNLIISKDCSIIYKDVLYNYTDIVHRVELVLSAIIRNSKKNSIRIGVYFRNDLDTLISIIAILSSDNSYIPIDVSLPIARVNQIIHDECDLLLTDQDINFLEIDKRKIVLKNKFDECTEIFTNEFGRGEAYTIYTSGSTGNPKGVVISKNSLRNFLDGTSKAIDVSNCYVSISITSCSFDIYIMETLWALQRGLKVVLIENSKRLNIKYIIKEIMDYEVDFFQTTPSRFRLLAIHKQFEDMLCYIKVLVLGGEGFPDELRDRVMSNTLKVYNAYGPTECTVWTSYSLVNRSDKVDIGLEINNVEYQLLTQEKKEGYLLGELLIGGGCLSDGYRDYKDLNMEKFIILNGQKYFRTGDVCKYEDGKYYILGRYDNQVKINGNRIELEEIENVVKKIKGINEAIVVKQTCNERDYLQLIYSSNDNIEEKRIKNYLSKVIPCYMIPTKYLKIESFDYTISGKIDRKKIRKDIFDEKV
jgi:amino acid adenylation domain-containing protein